MASTTLQQSLTNMSVYTDQAPSNQALLMPKLQYRFRVTFSGFGLANDPATITRQVVDVTRPNLSFQEVTLPVYNSTIYLAGKHSWQPISITVRDDALGSITSMVGEQLQKQLDFAQMSSAVSGIDYKFVTYIEMLDGGNGAIAPLILETWELGGCFLASVNYNNMNYANSEAVTLSLSIRYDNAIQLGATGVASGVGESSGTRTYGSDATGLGVGTLSTGAAGGLPVGV